MEVTTTVLWIMAMLSIGCVVSALTAKRRSACAWLSFAFTASASIGMAALAVQAILSPSGSVGAPLFGIPILESDAVFGLDGLGAIFLLTIAVLGFVAALYSIGYITHPHYASESLTRYYPFFFVFLLGMVGVTVAWDLFIFLVFWEAMTLASYFLVIFEGENRTSLRAGFKYFVMTHVATACLIAAFVILRLKGGSFGFAEARGAFAEILFGGGLAAHGFLLLLFVGFATKAAIFPLGDWLPDAHPAAPSPISCLLSGVMIKLGVYGILRTFLWIAPSSPIITTWGGVIAFFGALSLFVGTMEALAQHDAKRLLAFHSMGQMGYIFLGIGIGLAFLRISPALSAVGFIGGLYHLVNHACFKGLLFLNAGSTLIRAGTRELDRLGGLSRMMPLTATTAVVASFAIAGIPPMNGFGSKWMLYQGSLFAGLQTPAFLLYGFAALFISAVTLASFVKFLAASFFGQPSANITERAAAIHEVPASMQISQVILAAGCVILGVLPFLAVGPLHQALAAQRPGLFPEAGALFSGPLAGISIHLGEGNSSVWNPLPILLGFGVCLLIPLLLYRASGATVRKVPPWLCGEVHPPDEVRYGAGGFYLTFRSLTAPVVGRARAAGFYPRWPSLRAGWLAPVRTIFNFDFIYGVVVSALMKSFGWVSRVHSGYPQVYVLWMAAGLVVAVVLLYTLH